MRWRGPCRFPGTVLPAGPRQSRERPSGPIGRPRCSCQRPDSPTSHLRRLCQRPDSPTDGPDSPTSVLAVLPAGPGSFAGCPAIPPVWPERSRRLPGGSAGVQQSCQFPGISAGHPGNPVSFHPARPGDPPNPPVTRLIRRPGFPPAAPLPAVEEFLRPPGRGAQEVPASNFKILWPSTSHQQARCRYPPLSPACPPHPPQQCPQAAHSHPAGNWTAGTATGR